jgi:hypothetical protein
MNKREKITLSSVVQRNTDMLFSKMDEEVVMLSIQNSEYYGLNEIGSTIWEMIEKPVQVETLMLQLMEEYEVERRQAESDILALLNALYNKKIVHLVYE